MRILFILLDVIDGVDSITFRVAVSDFVCAASAPFLALPLSQLNIIGSAFALLVIFTVKVILLHAANAYRIDRGECPLCTIFVMDVCIIPFDGHSTGVLVVAADEDGKPMFLLLAWLVTGDLVVAVSIQKHIDGYHMSLGHLHLYIFNCLIINNNYY